MTRKIGKIGINKDSLFLYYHVFFLEEIDLRGKKIKKKIRADKKIRKFFEKRILTGSRWFFV